MANYTIDFYCGNDVRVREIHTVGEMNMTAVSTSPIEDPGSVISSHDGSQTSSGLEVLRPFRASVDKLVEFLSLPHRAFLLGAGCSKCAGLPLTQELTNQLKTNETISPKTKDIISSLEAAFQGSSTPTIEDYLSELVDWISISERRKRCGAQSLEVNIHESSFKLDEVSQAVNELKWGIVQAINKPTKIAIHRSFIRAIHNELQAGKSIAGSAVDYFVLNYDTLVEDALGFERLSVSDGFSGAATGWWNADSFEVRHESARVFKMHGSIDWRLMDNDVLPHRIRPIAGEDVEGGKYVVMWPAATKYRETQRDPYAQILKLFRNALRRHDKPELVLTVIGYRFGDAHINEELTQGLRESNGNLTIVAFTEDSAPTGKLKEWLDDSNVCDQVCVYAKRGFFHRSDVIDAHTDLPWWKFEVITRLLGGER